MIGSTSFKIKKIIKFTAMCVANVLRMQLIFIYIQQKINGE